MSVNKNVPIKPDNRMVLAHRGESLAVEEERALGWLRQGFHRGKAVLAHPHTEGFEFVVG
jgi:hypothetical protein